MTKKKRKKVTCSSCFKRGHNKRGCRAAVSAGKAPPKTFIGGQDQAFFAKPVVAPAEPTKKTLEETRQSETEDTIYALVLLVNEYAHAAGVKMHLEPSYRVGKNTVHLIDGPDLDNAQAVAAIAGAIHQAQAPKGAE